MAKEIIKFIKQHPGKSGIIYCLSRKKVEEIAETETAVRYSLDIMIDGRIYWEPRLPWNLVFTNWENININWENV